MKNLFIVLLFIPAFSYAASIDKYIEKTSVSEVAEGNDAQSSSDKNDKKNDKKIDVEKSLDPEITETNKEE